MPSSGQTRRRAVVCSGSGVRLLRLDRGRAAGHPDAEGPLGCRPLLDRLRREPPKTVDLLDAVRRKRNQNNYEHAGTTSAAEAKELQEVVTTLRGDVLRWLKKTHPALCPPGLTR